MYSSVSRRIDLTVKVGETGRERNTPYNAFNGS